MVAPSVSRTRLLLLASGLFCLSLFITAYSGKNKSVGNAAGVVLGEALRPFQIATSSVHEFIRDRWQSYLALVDTKRNNKLLEQRIKVLEAQNTRLREYDVENRRLSALLGFVGEHKLSGVWARVIGHDPSSWVEAVTVDKGEKDGIQIGQAVVEHLGVVGQVVALSRNSARILLITDNASGIDALLQNEHTRGVVKGRGDNKCVLEYVPRDEEVKIGDKVVSSGMDGVYPKGLLIGRVLKILTDAPGLFHRIEVEPVVDFLSLEDVYIVTAAS